MSDRQYIAIDLKSFYASVECVARGLDPLCTNLVVADEGRTEKTICLAVTPSLKAWGISGRARHFEVIERLREVNADRRMRAPGRRLTGKSYDDRAIKADPSLAVSYLVAPPRMATYMEVSTQVYNVYLKYIAPEDIHTYSVDEVFIDATHYLKTYRCTARELAMTMIRDVLKTTGITATAGIGTNLYLAKVAMDIMAKKMPADSDGVRIAELTEQTYREQLWEHRPLTAFWRVGRGIASKLEAHGMHTMGDVAMCSVRNEEVLYQMFGVNAELLIDHAWGWEPCRIADIKAYKPRTSSLSSGQVLTCPYPADKARLVVHEMIDSLSLELVEKGLLSNQLVLDVGYDIENLADPHSAARYDGEIITDRYGRKVPKYAHGTANLEEHTSSTRRMTEAMLSLYDRIVDPRLTVRRMTVTAANTLPEQEATAAAHSTAEQLDLFTDYAALEAEREVEREALRKERARQETIIALRKKYGKNAILRGMNYEEGATARERNRTIGGHKA